MAASQNVSALEQVQVKVGDAWKGTTPLAGLPLMFKSALLRRKINYFKQRFLFYGYFFFQKAYHKI